ncbi:MAG: PEGA domain-containing protein [Tepidisphaeraceae bacterium]
MFQPAKEQVMINTEPSGVEVYVDGESRGKSPVKVPLQRNKSHTIVAATQGAVYTRELNPKLSAAGTLDIVGAAVILVPGVGLLAPGAYDLDKTIMLRLQPSYTEDELVEASTAPSTTQPVR